MRWRLLTGSVLALVAGLSWWLAGEPPIVERQTNTPADGGEIDYYLRDLEFATYSEDGVLARTLIAPEMRHYPADDSTELDRPRMTIHRADAPPWRVRSDSGWVSPDGERVHLRGEVFIERDAGKDVRPMQILTRNLWVEPERDYAETDEPVTVTSLTDRIDSVGMQAWLNEPGRIKFLSQVRGRHVVPN